MATTSIWRVKGWLGKVVIYVENPDKTDNPEYFEKQDMTDADMQGLSDVIAYAVKSEKTQVADDENIEIMKQFVSGVNCLPATARDEMTKVKMRFGKERGVVAYHGYQSFAPGECTPEQAHEIGLKLANILWGEKYQVLVATHLDKAHHLHNHFVVNTVSFIDGIRYHRTEKDYYDMQVQSDNLCREYGLSVLPNPKGKKSKHIAEIKAEQEGKPTIRNMIKTDIDMAISQSMTEKQFFDNLRKMHYEVEIKKYIYVKPEGRKYFYKLERNLGDDYSIENIRKRILAQNRPQRPLPEYRPSPKQYKLKGNYKTTRKITEFRALYMKYCYKLGIFPKNKPQSKKRIYWLYREDLIRMDAISDEAKLLIVNKIDTAEQLTCYKSLLEMEVKTLTTHRAELYKKSRTVAIKRDETKLSETKSEISSISKKLRKLRRDVKLCEDIAIRSGVISEKMKQANEIENSQRKELMINEQRRCGRTNR